MKVYSLSSLEVETSQQRDPLLRLITQEIVDRLPDGSGKDLLDLGCGAGRTSIAAADKGYRVLGIDIENKVLEIAKKTARDHGVANRCTFTRLDISTGKNNLGKKFDVAVCSEVIEHLKNPRRLLLALSRQLKAGAVVILSTPHDLKQWSILDEYGEHVKRYSRDELQLLLRKVGLVVEKIDVIGFPFMRMIIWIYDKMARRLDVNHGSHYKKSVLYGVVYTKVMPVLLKVDTWFNWTKKGTTLIVVARKSA